MGSDNVTATLATALCFALVAGGTWFFSSHPRSFIRTFVPREEWRDVVRSMRGESSFRRGMRWMALLQFAVAILILVVTVIVWLLNR